MTKRALITGASGQDAAWLSQLLLSKGYKVFLTDRHVSTAENRYWRLVELGILDRVEIIHASLEHYETLIDALHVSRPDEIYHLAAQSFVTASFESEFETLDVNLGGTHRLLRAYLHYFPRARFYFAATSEMFGMVEETPQTELTKFHPRSPYGVSKVAAFEMVRHYRERYGLFCLSGVLMNHESALRGEQFVTRKISKGAVAAAHGGPKIHLGNLQAKRDWGHARDFTEGMWLMLQQDKPDDFLLATGHTHSIEEFLAEAFAVVSELAGSHFPWPDYVEIDPAFFRPTEVDLLLGDATKARTQLLWQPKTSFKQLVREMVEADWKRANR